MANEKLYSIQALRGFAALLVVFHHVGWFVSSFGSHGEFVGSMQRVWEFGAVGVDVFFVISGFFMVYVTKSSSSLGDVKRFLRNRIFRVVPLYWFATLAMFLFLILFSAKNKPSFSYLANSLFFIPKINANSGKMHPVLDQGWTLNYEMGFYFLFASLMWLPTHLRNVFIFLCFLLAMLVGSPNGFFIFWSNPIVFEFFLGVILASYFRFSVRLPLWVLGAGVLLSVLYMYVFFDMGLTGLNRLFVSGFGAFFLVFCFLQIEYSGRWLSFFRNKFTQLMGDSSYSIYLMHSFATVACGFLLKKMGGFVTGEIVDFLFFFFGFVLSVSLGLFIYFRVELPMNLFIKKRYLVRN